MPTIETGRSVTVRESQQCDLRTPVRTRDLPAGAVQRAVLLVGAVHDEGPAEVASLLHPLGVDDFRALAVTLAAMVPADCTPGELLAWNDAQYARLVAPPKVAQAPLFPVVVAGPRELKPHGSHAAFNRHKKRGEDPCEPCEFGERDYQRDRKRRVRGQARAVAAAAS